MGSSASTAVKAIDKDTEKADDTKRSRSKTSTSDHQKCTLVETDLNLPSNVADITADEASEKLKDLEKQLAESESQNLDLQERIQNLEDRLTEQLQAASEEEVCRETLQAKDQYISKLEQELQTVQQEASKMKVRHKKKLKSVMSQLTEAKQGASIDVFELKDEINRLREENNSLKNKFDPEPSVPGDPTTGTAHSMSGHMSLILDLSQQVSEQQEKIRKLEENLKEKNKTIQKYKMSSGNDGADGVMKDEVLVSTSWNEQTQVNGNSEFMSSGWHSVTDSSRSKMTKQQDLAPVEECSAEEDSKYLSRSRDSGIGSAGKTKTNDDTLSLNVSKRIGSASSLLSGLAHDDSDSDWGSDSMSSPSNKAQSAPPGSRSPYLLPPSGREEQRGDNWANGTPMGKARKKKSVLRSKIARNKDGITNDDLLNQRPGLSGPTLAFVETA